MSLMGSGVYSLDWEESGYCPLCHTWVDLHYYKDDYGRLTASCPECGQDHDPLTEPTWDPSPPVYDPSPEPNGRGEYDY